MRIRGYTRMSGSNTTADGSLRTSMSSSLSKDFDSIDVAKMSKGGASAPQTLSASGQSSEISCVGFNSILVYVSSITGTWDISVQCATASGGTAIDAYDDRGTQMKITGLTVVRCTAFRGVTDYIKLNLNMSSAGSITFRVVPINV